MSRPTLFISDLHLPAQPSTIRDAFLRFLSVEARRADALYILGDLFEYWIGDDEGLRRYAPEAGALRGLVRHGVAVNLLHGNRDFLVGPDFCKATGVRLLADPTQLELGGIPTLLMHGDLLCTGDVRYQRWRRIARHPAFRYTYLSLPAGLRQRIAGGVRAATTADMRAKPAEIMDVSESSVKRAFLDTGAVRIIHGHTHRPADHRYEIAGQARERIVLADWRPNLREALVVEGTDCRRLPLEG